jgi:UDP-GlcNAc:undecaprenyl-phosphate GlcNAc-1-phosphate transferase
MLTALVLSFVLCLLLIPQVRALACRVGLVDRPDGRRKLHRCPIPVAGGPAIFAAVTLALVAALPPAGAVDDLAPRFPPHLISLFFAALVICAVGVADDFGRLRGRHKLVGQCAAVAIVIASGVQVRSIHFLGWGFDLDWMSIPFTAFFLLGAINSLNLLDGMDGLLGSVAFIICLALGAMAFYAGQTTTACVALAMAGALFAFLLFNFPPASLFLGDSGSMLVGLIVGDLAISSSLKGPATVALAFPMGLLIIPIFDTTAAIIRRKLTGRSLYTTDRGHLHHCLMQRLTNQRVVLLVVSACCLLTAGGAFASLVYGNELVVLCTALMVIGVLVTTRLFGHAECLLVKKRLTGFLASFFQMRGERRFRRMDVHMHGTIHWKALLDRVAEHAFDLNLKTVHLDVSVPALNEEYHAQWDRFEKEVEGRLWRAEVPLMFGGNLVGALSVSGFPDAEPLAVKVAALAQMIEDFGKAHDKVTRIDRVTRIDLAPENNGLALPHVPVDVLPEESGDEVAV